MFNSFAHPRAVIGVLTDVWADTVGICVVSDMGVDVLAGMNVNVLPSLMTVLELVKSASLEESVCLS